MAHKIHSRYMLDTWDTYLDNKPPKFDNKPPVTPRNALALRGERAASWWVSGDGQCRDETQ